METKPVWLPPDIHAEVMTRKAELKHRRADQTIEYLIRLERSIKKADKQLYEKLTFNLN